MIQAVEKINDETTPVGEVEVWNYKNKADGRSVNVPVIVQSPKWRRGDTAKALAKLLNHKVDSFRMTGTTRKRVDIQGIHYF
jgi:hypothetical protein